MTRLARSSAAVAVVVAAVAAETISGHGTSRSAAAAARADELADLQVDHQPPLHDHPNRQRAIQILSGPHIPAGSYEGYVLQSWGLFNGVEACSSAEAMLQPSTMLAENFDLDFGARPDIPEDSSAVVFGPPQNGVLTFTPTSGGLEVPAVNRSFETYTTRSSGKMLVTQTTRSDANGDPVYAW